MFNPFMAMALNQAQFALDNGEVPVGAVIVKDGIVITSTYNMREMNQNAIAHAEILAINKACVALKSWRLDECDIYVTLEPCIMCAGAIINARVNSVYFGAYEKNNGAFGGILDCTKLTSIHKPTVYGGIMEDNCNEMLRLFFNKIRHDVKESKDCQPINRYES